MTKIFFFLNLILIAFGAHKHWWEGSKVQELTVQNFYDYVGKSSHVIVEFYAPWCHYCQAMAQHYEELHEMYNGENPKRKDVLISRINGNDHQEITQNYGIYSYPSIVHFPPESRFIDSVFQQHRTKDMMSHWIENICGPEKKEENKIHEQEKNSEDKKNETNNLDEEGDNKKMLNILITISDELKFLDKTHREDNEKIISILQKQPNSEVTSNQNNENLGFKSWEVNLKHVSIFFMLGMFIGMAFAFTLVKLRKLNHIIPLKNI